MPRLSLSRTWQLIELSYRSQLIREVLRRSKLFVKNIRGGVSGEVSGSYYSTPERVRRSMLH
jgi:hypothetical protein